ncbi:MAG TPA: TetR family transcriptional regulator [Solirubrobacteraceae bacterium]|jgi:AcrR family transcriptional regulator|nr:TetR family transcriptional regulator [Solirubrobacteraceae bacterium]
MATELGLRERKKQHTRQLISDTARRLFAERGFEQVTVADVARAADVSEGTVFNYFPAKEDLVYGRMEAFEEEMMRAIRERPSGESMLSAFGRFVLEPRGLLATNDAQASEELAKVTRVIAESPALLAREIQIFERYTRTLAGLIAQETGNAHDDVEAWVTANALIGVHRALIDHVRRQVLAGVPTPRIARGVRSHGKRALALLEQGLDGVHER